MVISQASVIKEYETKVHDTNGCPGHFTADEQRKVAKLWTLLLDYFENNKDKSVKVNGEFLQKIERDWSDLDVHEGLSDEEPEEVTRRAWKFTKGDSTIRKFSIRSKKEKPNRERQALDRHVNETVQQYMDRIAGHHVTLIPDKFFPSFEHPSTETRDFRDTFWNAASIKQHPDFWVHRFLRACGWDVDKTFAMLKSVVEWRAAEAVDKINYEGEVGSGYDEVRLGFSKLVGRDRLGCPLLYVRVRRIMPRANEGFVFKRYLINQFECLQAATRKHTRTTMLYDFTGFCMENTPFSMVYFMVFLGIKYYAEASGVMILLVDSWLFTNFWNLIRPFLDANLSARIVFAKTVDEVRRFIDDDQLPTALGGKNTFESDFVLPKEGENAPMFELEGRKEAEKIWRVRISEFEKATKEWCSYVESTNSGNIADPNNSYAVKRDEAGERLCRAELELNKYTRSRNNLERTGLVDENGCLLLPQDKQQST
ncbi:CRAL-TRIO domain-containing protein [Coemansia spiralis]|nr:CRAL-TRIO domain-containing protein [Coemansia spiralis]